MAYIRSRPLHWTAGLLLLSALATAGWAQTSRPATEPADQRRPAAALIERFRQACTQLDLSPDQQTKISQALDDAEQKLPQLRREMQLDPDGARGKIQNFIQETRRQVIAVLTPEQQQKLRELVAGRNGAPAAPQLARTAQKPATAPSTEPAGLAAPKIGQDAPPFEMDQTDGRHVNLTSSGKRVIVMFFGSLTSPSFRQRIPEMEALKSELSGTGSIQWMIVYTREPHPAGGWEVERNHDDNISVEQPADMVARTRLAQRVREQLHLTMPMAVDTMDDAAANAYGVVASHFSNAAVVIGRDGRIVAYQKWADPPRLKADIQKAVQALPPTNNPEAAIKP